MHGNLKQGLCLVSKHSHCTWLVNTGSVLGNLTQGLRLVSYHRVCAC